MEEGIEFVKHFKAHLGTITDINVSYDGSKLLSVAEDCAMKIYDVVNFDMMHMLRLGFVPACAKVRLSWIYVVYLRCISGIAMSFLFANTVDIPKCLLTFVGSCQCSRGRQYIHLRYRKGK